MLLRYEVEWVRPGRSLAPECDLDQRVSEQVGVSTDATITSARTTRAPPRKKRPENKLNALWPDRAQSVHPPPPLGVIDEATQYFRRGRERGWGLPTTIVIDRDGLIAKRHSGIGSMEQFEREIQLVL